MILKNTNIYRYVYIYIYIERDIDIHGICKSYDKRISFFRPYDRSNILGDNLGAQPRT